MSGDDDTDDNQKAIFETSFGGVGWDFLLMQICFLSVFLTLAGLRP